MKNTKLNDIRNNWSFKEIESFFKMPFNDLILRAQIMHKKYFKKNEVQLSTLLSIKTGSCPEDCSYCPQSAHHNTNLKKEKLIDIEKVEKAAIQAKKQGSTRFCLGAAWRKPTDKDLKVVWRREIRTLTRCCINRVYRANSALIMDYVFKIQ